MTWLDYAVIGVFAVSLVLGAWRGIVREVISILGWVIAFLAASLLARRSWRLPSTVAEVSRV